MEMLLAIDVIGSDVWRSSNKVDFDLDRLPSLWVVGFETVVAVGWFPSSFVNSDQPNVSCFEQSVQVDTAQGTVVGVTDQSG